MSSATKDKSKVHKLSLKGTNLAVIMYDDRQAHSSRVVEAGVGIRKYSRLRFNTLIVLIHQFEYSINSIL